MDISFHGAAREVTGSCYLVETKRSRVLVDCGAFQGSSFVEAKNFEAFRFDPASLDAVIVTHAHLDHVGRLPKLAKDGFRGKIYLTPPTAQLASLVLHDAFQIMREEFDREYRPMLYDEADIGRVERMFSPLDYGKRLTVNDLTFRLHDAGHIFGSAFVELRQTAPSTSSGLGGPRIVFSGDLGNVNTPILRPTEELSETDALVIESTYGNRVHEDESTREAKLRDVIINTIKRKGALLIPAFAIERTQELLYELNDLVESKTIPSIDIYLDSPMAIQATKVLEEYPQYYSPEAWRRLVSGDDMFQFPGLRLCLTRDDSKAINTAPWPKIIIAGSGMMNGGRILHHLVRYLSNPDSTVLIIGYQAEHTLGRKLYRGDKVVQVLGERVDVRASVISIGAYSAHADQNKLVGWVAAAKTKPSKIFVTHGDENASAALATRFNQELGLDATVPHLGDRVTL